MSEGAHLFQPSPGMSAQEVRVLDADARQHSFDVGGATVNIRSVDEAVSAVTSAAEQDESAYLCTLNLDHCTKLRSDARFRTAYRHARFVTADGFPIVMLGRMHGVSLERAAGSDLIWPLCREALRRHLSIAFYGASVPVLRKAQLHIMKRLPGIDIVGIQGAPPVFDPESVEADEAIEFIRRSRARLCFLAIGAPRQEVFALRCLDRVPGTTFICIGAGLDFIAGTQARAPRFFQEHGLEWLWRLASNPRRLGMRYLRCAGAVPRLAAEALPNAISLRRGKLS